MSDIPLNKNGEVIRPSWDKYFMSIANIVRTRSTCVRRQVGAVLVNDKHQIISTGYNGVPRNIRHCTIANCPKLHEKSGEKNDLCPAVHAELNAIIQAATASFSPEGATLYTTTRPCSSCTKAIINAGIKRVVFTQDYTDPLLRSGWLNTDEVNFELYKEK